MALKEEVVSNVQLLAFRISKGNKAHPQEIHKYYKNSECFGPKCVN